MAASISDLTGARTLVTKRGLRFRARPLRHGEARTVMSLFEQLGEASRRSRFHGPKPCLSRSELRLLASVDETHYALVAQFEDDPQPIAIARLVRDGDEAEVAFAVADEYQNRGIGSALTAQLLADARASGIRKITALVGGDNSAAIHVLRSVATGVTASYEGSDLFIEAAVAA